MSALWNADELATALGCTAGFDAHGISIDTRSLEPGDLFVALQDARDGHDFVAEALAKGAAGALISRDMDIGGNLLRVADTLEALHRLGEFARARSNAKILAVTGSVGKTTTKEMLRRALGGFGSVHAAEASFNNHIGVPLTLARMPREADFAVLEIGMNHPGEILPLARLVRPHVAIITNVERTHIGLMGSLDAIAAEKSSIFQGLIKSGMAVAPSDSAYVSQLCRAVPAGVVHITFGTQETATARLMAAASTAAGCDVTGVVAGEPVRFHLNAPGKHMAMNAMAVLAACHGAGLDIEKAAAALDGFAPVAGRGASRTIMMEGGEALLLDESYNASGASMRAAFTVLSLQPGRHVAVLGDMLELGADAADEHLGLRGDLMHAADIAFTCGEMMGLLFNSLPVERQGAHARDAATLAPIVQAEIRPGDAVLIKGSYGSRMRDVVNLLQTAA